MDKCSNNESISVQILNILLKFFLLLIFFACSDKATNPEKDDFTLQVFEPVAVSKSNSIKVYMHYMPWFASKEIDGQWGSHWTMANRNPDIVDLNNQREIASHYYPLIGPYSSADKDVIEYHLLLMKLAGIDGVFLDWYGTFVLNDYSRNLQNSEALIDMLDETGLKFSIVYEDYTAENVVNASLANSAVLAAKTDIKYMVQNYWSSAQYINAGGGPLLLTFGPRFFQTELEWSQIFNGISPKPAFLTLWNESMEAGSNARGEFAWVYKNNLTDLENFYNNRAPGQEIAIAAAYPGFNDYYKEGGWGEQVGWEIAHNETATLSSTLQLAEQSGLSMLQLVTWNDFGEGTMMEPTIEFGYTFLEKIQEFTGVSYSVQNLEQIKRLYDLRKQYKNDAKIQVKLDQVFYYFVSLQLDKAEQLLKEFG
ncbi:MAG: hypothetical protein KDF60_11420 [Calditrichaeota bacterium]|nr:hypothetical protein [Calditrichota bacterium]